jgi:hypothetical protein
MGTLSSSRFRRLIRYVSIYYPKILEHDQAKIKSLARCLGVKKYEFSAKEFRSLKRVALEIPMKHGIVEQFDRSFEYMYECQHWMRIDTFNYICGLGLNGAIKNYARIADAIKKGERETRLVCTFS